MNKMAIIAGEIATGPALGSTPVIINIIRQPSVRRPRVAALRRRRAEPRRIKPRRRRRRPPATTELIFILPHLLHL